MERIPPQSVLAEQVVLGSMLQNSICACNIRTMLSDDDFYREAHRTIFGAIIHLVEHGQIADLITVTDYLRIKNMLDDIGGIAYLTALHKIFYSEKRFWACARIVAEKSWQRRQLIELEMIKMHLMVIADCLLTERDKIRKQNNFEQKT